MGTTFRVVRQFYKYNMDQKAVAAALGVNDNTLRAKLQREGSSYNNLLRRVRRRMLDRLLKDGKTVDCITFELGYQSNKTFLLAFKDMMGVSWREYHK